MRIINDLQAFDAFRHSAFRFLKSLAFSRDVSPHGSSHYGVEVVLSSGSEEADGMLRLLCTGVTDIKVGDINGTVSVLLSIHDIKAQQLEGMNYRVGETENDLFSFACEGFEVEVA